MDAAWVPQLCLVGVFAANFALEAFIGTTSLHTAGWFRFYHKWIFGRLWSGPAYALPLLAQPRLPTVSGTWWAGVIGDSDHVLAQYSFDAVGVVDLAGWTLFAAAWTLWIWAFIPKHPWAMQPPDTICRDGAYRCVRHPVNLGWLLFITGWYWLWGGVYSLWLSPLFYAFFVLEAFWEERFLLEQGANNEAYRNYRRDTPMFIPDLSRLRGDA